MWLERVGFLFKEIENILDNSVTFKKNIVSSTQGHKDFSDGPVWRCTLAYLYIYM